MAKKKKTPTNKRKFESHYVMKVQTTRVFDGPNGVQNSVVETVRARLKADLDVGLDKLIAELKRVSPFLYEVRIGEKTITKKDKASGTASTAVLSPELEAITTEMFYEDEEPEAPDCGTEEYEEPESASVDVPDDY